MTGMPITPAHAKPVSRRDHLWVLAVIAACALIKVSPSWVGIGAAAGFPRFAGMPTDWTLAVVTDAYWAYALYAWLAASPGPRSRRFAMWSAWAVCALSLIGQSAARLVPAAVLSVFANALPVIVLALIAVLVHLRHLDRAEAQAVAEAAGQAAQQAAVERAEVDERTALRAQVEALRDEMSDAVTARDDAQQERAVAVAKAETLTRKLAATGGRKRGVTAKREQARKPAGATARKPESATGPGDVSDVDAEALVLKYLDEGHSASKAGVMAGLSDSRGRQIARKLASAAPKGQDEESTP